MNRHILGLGLALAAAASLAPRADAFPDLVASDTPGGWSLPALPRSSGDATAGSCVLQAPALPGESASTWFNGSMHNIGTNTAPGAFQALYLDDALKTIQGPYNVLPLGYGSYVNVPSSLVLKGGRHTLLSRADVFGGVPETNEGNNDWTRQYIWSPLALTAGVPVTRTSDPPASTTGSGPWLNSEGFSVTTIPGQWWFAVAVLGTNASSDFDVRLHDEAPSNVPQAGFGTYTAWSGWYTDHLDAVIVNRNVAPAGTYYAGVTTWTGTANKVVQFEAAPPTYISAPGVYGPFTMAAGDIIDLHELYAFTSDLLQIELVPLAGDANLSMSLIGSIGEASLQDNVGSADSNGAGYTERMWVTLAATHFHGLAVYKHDSSDLSKYCTYEIRVSPYPNLVGDHTPLGWDGPIVPRNSDDATFPVTLPPSLNGDQQTTSYNFSFYNYGPGTASSSYLGSLISVDDDPRWVHFVNEPVYWNNYGLMKNTPIGNSLAFVRGGRHYLRSDIDWYNQITELAPYETDNVFVDWFVWNPSTLADQTPVVRNFPPYAYPSGVGAYPACDGVRSSGFASRYWSAVGIMPGSMGGEFDMRLHAPSTGPKDGFGDWLTWSFDTFPGNPDFCIVNYNVAPMTQYDFSVINWGGYVDSYTVQQADAPYELYLTPGLWRLGPFTLGASDVLDMHEFYVDGSLIGTPVHISANNVSGGVDLEVWAFDGQYPYHTKFSAMAGVNANGPGGDEHLPAIYFDHAGYYALVVNKSKATDNGHAASYELVFKTGSSVVDAPVVAALPTEFALAAPRPNPSSSGTTVELDVPAGKGKATVAVYDLAGRRVRTLVEGEATPGRHVLRWDGRDASGLKAAAGVYFVRLETADRNESKKITLLR